MVSLPYTSSLPPPSRPQIDFPSPLYAKFLPLLYPLETSSLLQKRLVMLLDFVCNFLESVILTRAGKLIEMLVSDGRIFP